MKTNKLAKLIEKYPKLEIVFYNDNLGLHIKGTVEHRKILKWSDVPVDIITLFPYIESEFFYNKEYLLHEMELAARSADIKVSTYLKKLDPYWKEVIIVWEE